MSAEFDARLANRILLGLVIGALAGMVVLLIGGVAPQVLDSARAFATNVCDPLGQVFLRMLFFVVIPLVFASLASGVVQLGELSHLGPLAGRTFTLFFLNMAIAATLGLLMMNVLQPGNRLDDETSARLIQEYSGQAEKHVQTNAERPEMTPSAVVDRVNLYSFLIRPSSLETAAINPGQTRTVLSSRLRLPVSAETVTASIVAVKVMAVPLLATRDAVSRPIGTATMTRSAVERSAITSPTGRCTDSATVMWAPCARRIR